MGTQAGSSGRRRASARAVALLCLALAVAAALCFAATASAQILPPLPPLPGGGGGGGGPVDPGFASPSVTLAAPQGTAPMYGIDASRTGHARDSTVFGPLELAWSRSLPPGSNAPLVAGGLVLASASLSNGDYGARVVAMSRATGRIVWQRSLDNVYYDAYIGAGDGIVAAVNRDGDIYAFSLKNGKHLWTQNLQAFEGAAPVIDDGVVYASLGSNSAGDGELVALDTDDGRIIWSRDVSIASDASEPALDQARVFLSDECGNALAVSRATGATIWSVERGGSECYYRSTTIVSGGRVFAARGYVYDAVTGAELGRTSIGTAGAVVNGVAFSASGKAQRLTSDKLTWKAPFGSYIRPVVGDGTVYLRDSRWIVGVDVATGRPLSQIRSLRPGGGGEQPGLSLGAGMLVLSEAGRVQAFRPKMRPPRRGSVLFTNKSAVPAGGKVLLSAGVGAALRKKGRRVTLLAAPAGARKLHGVKRARTRSDGTAVFSLRLHRNTRVMADPAGGKRSHGGTLYANPGFSIKVRRTSDTRGVISTGVSRVPGGQLAKRKLVAYIVKVGKKVVSRLGAAPLHRTGKQSARAKVRFKLLKHVGRRDYLFVCVPGLARAGWGFVDRYQRRCGAKRLKYGKRRRTSTAARIARPRTLPGAGSPGGLLHSARGRAGAASEAAVESPRGGGSAAGP